MKIGEIVSASVSGGLVAKLALEEPEDLRIGYPVIVEGTRYSFYCLVHDIENQELDLAERLAGSGLQESILPEASHEGFSGKIFYSKARLRPIQLIDLETGALSEPETIPPYFSEARHALREDVEQIYEVTEGSAPLGTIRGVEKFYVHLDFEKLTEKPFGIFGRTGMGKTILNKLVCTAILARDVASVLIFDMHGEYGVHSRGRDATEGLKFYHPHKVELFSLDPKVKVGRPFFLNPAEIQPEDLIVALQEQLNENMVDALYAIHRERGGRDLLTAIRDRDVLTQDENTVHVATLQALKRRIKRLERFPFVRSGGTDAFAQLIALVKQGKSIVLDFGEFGTDSMAYLFVASILARRLFDLYTEENEKYPRLVLFLEEAHKFLAPEVAHYTIFSRLARETRKFNLILALVDQRPARIDEEVRSQLANRLVLSLKETSDVESALAGVPDKGMWTNLVSAIPARTVAIIGDAIRVPTLVEVMDYTMVNVKEHITGLEKSPTEIELDEIEKAADKVFGG